MSKADDELSRAERALDIVAGPGKDTAAFPTVGTYRFAGFELDAASRTLTAGGESLTAEPRVLDLIIYLVQHHNRVISRDELHDVVWSGQVVGDGAITRCVYQARQILINDAGVELIRTVQRRGYQFAVVPERLAVGGANRHPLRRLAIWLLPVLIGVIALMLW